MTDTLQPLTWILQLDWPPRINLQRTPCLLACLLAKLAGRLARAQFRFALAARRPMETEASLDASNHIDSCIVHS